MSNKTCNKCGKLFPLEQFYCNSLMADGHVNVCKACCREKKARYYQQNAERLKRRARERREADPELDRQRQAASYQRHRKKRLAANKAYRQRPEVRDRLRAKKQAYYEANKHKLLEACKAYRDSSDGQKVMRRAHAKEKVKHADKIVARYYLANALRDGKINKPDRCEKCGRESSIQGHHYNGYDLAHSLDVLWLCPECHVAEHRQVARLAI